ncbi:Acyl-CoA dehydrogenase [Pseudonocardia ammonioxydans]|uniref:Acyl-CoA dehydrogenase n=1 Tax=Pseudonocardia ammonioxydans TaxID=260086 RepID=A0A1I5BFI4_PSUAM|nr:acyl-CoA dehydrogenase family protein [Pseudonocardia ammonioxydans]SFN73452.1 Acyl-CoA dehydrogenase [Pseudonocardia ammonioxydans]
MTAAADPDLGTWFRAAAGPVDRGEDDVRTGLRRLGDADLIAPPGSGTAHAVALVERIAGECMSSAFATWAQRMAYEYLVRAAHPEDVLSDEIRRGSRVGATAMAPALRDLAGLEPVPVVARPSSDGGLVLDGPIRWASNLFDDAVVVLPVRLGPTGGARAVVRICTADTGVVRAPRPTLLALNGTGSTSVRLEEVRIPAEAVLSEDLPGFVGAIRPTFLLVQSAFCSGLATRSATSAVEAATGGAEPLAPDARAVAARASDVHDRLHTLAADPVAAAPADLLRLRLDAATTATDATRVESAAHGGAGYVAASDVARRLREGAFLPVQAPTEGHLRWELSRSQ